MIRIFSPFNIAALIGVAFVTAYGLLNVSLDQQLAVHWDIFGQPDNFMAAKYALWIAPLGTALVVVAAVMYNRWTSTNQNQAGEAPANAGVTVALIAMCFVQLMIVIQGLGQTLDMPRMATLFIGFVLLFIGNYLPKSQRNNWSGIRTVWALNSDENWIKTHQFGGKTFMLAGLVALILGILNVPAPYNLAVAIAGVMVSALASIAYSYTIRNAA